MQKEIFPHIPDNYRFSLEIDFFPKMIWEKYVGFIIINELIDIGTTERYEKAVHLIGGSK